MKKRIALLLALVAILSLCACGKSANRNMASGFAQVTTVGTEETTDNTKEEAQTSTGTPTEETTAPTESTAAPTESTTAKSTEATAPACSHSWNAATCAAAKTCAKCGATEGSALGHNYSNGVCSRCGVAEAPGADTGMTKPDSIHDWFDDEVNERVYVTETTNVYSAPGTEYEVIGTLNKGDMVTRTSRGRLVGWNRIDYNGVRGYVKSGSLSTRDPSFIAAEAHGFSVGAVITLTDSSGVSYTLQYKGEDRWEDQNGTIWTSYQRDDGSLHFTTFGAG